MTAATSAWSAYRTAATESTTCSGATWASRASRRTCGYLPHLLELVLTRTIDPGKVFDLELPLAEVAEAYAAMDERRAIKVLLRP